MCTVERCEGRFVSAGGPPGDNLGSSQPDSSKHQGEDRSLDGAGAPVLAA